MEAAIVIRSNGFDSPYKEKTICVDTLEEMDDILESITELINNTDNSYQIQ